MPASHTLFSRPAAALGAVAVAFAAWVWFDVAAEPPVARPRLVNPDAAVVVVVDATASVGVVPPDAPPGPDPRRVAQALPTLRPGMSRSEVDAAVGSPVPEHVRPATAVGGRVTYTVDYAVDTTDLGAQPGAGVVALEFDATRIGHPLVAVHLPA